MKLQGIVPVGKVGESLRKEIDWNAVTIKNNLNCTQENGHRKLWPPL